MAKLRYLNDRDGHGMNNPQQQIGKLYLHRASARIYEIVGYSLNASSDSWALRYKPMKEDLTSTLKCEFTRDMIEFHDPDRFTEVK